MAGIVDSSLWIELMALESFSACLYGEAMHLQCFMYTYYVSGHGHAHIWMGRPSSDLLLYYACSPTMSWYPDRFFYLVCCLFEKSDLLNPTFAHSLKNTLSGGSCEIDTTKLKISTTVSVGDLEEPIFFHESVISFRSCVDHVYLAHALNKLCYKTRRKYALNK